MHIFGKAFNQTVIVLLFLLLLFNTVTTKLDMTKKKPKYCPIHIILTLWALFCCIILDRTTLVERIQLSVGGHAHHLFGEVHGTRELSKLFLVQTQCLRQIDAVPLRTSTGNHNYRLVVAPDNQPSCRLQPCLSTAAEDKCSQDSRGSFPMRKKSVMMGINATV